MKMPPFGGKGKDLGSPSEIGMGMKKPPAPSMDDAPPEDDESSETPKIQPEWVDYHTGEETCQNCSHMQNGNCEVLQMPVGPNDHCEAFSGGEYEGAEGMPPDSDAPPMPPSRGGYGS